MEKSRLLPSDPITPDVFLRLCPILVQQLDLRTCGPLSIDHHHPHGCEPCSPLNDSAVYNNHTSPADIGLPNTIEHRHGRLEHDSHQLDHGHGDVDHDHGHHHGDEGDHGYSSQPEVEANIDNSTSQSFMTGVPLSGKDNLSAQPNILQIHEVLFSALYMCCVY